MSSDLSLHHVQLGMPAGGEERARHFYADVLKLIEISKPAVLAARGGVWFRSRTCEIHLGVEEPFAPARKAHPGILVADAAEFDDLAARLISAGNAITPDRIFPASGASTSMTASVTAWSS